MRAYLKQPLVIATLFACLCGLLALGDPIDHSYWNRRFSLGHKQAPQSIVLVTVSAGEQGQNGGWTHDDDARLLEVLAGERPKEIYYDRPVDWADAPRVRAEFARLADKVTFVVRGVRRDALGEPSYSIPPADLVGRSKIVASTWTLNFLAYGLSSPFAVRIGGTVYPTLAPALAEVSGNENEKFIPDFAVDPRTIRTISGSQIVSGKLAPGLLTGASVVVSAVRLDGNSPVGYFGHGRIDPVNLDIAGVASLRSGASTNIGWIPLLVLAVAALYIASRCTSRRLRRLCYAIVVLVLLTLPTALQLAGMYSDPSASFLAAFAYGAQRMWANWRRKVIQTSQSGLPNFVAMVEQQIPDGHDVVVAVIGRYEEFLATLPQELHGECARQIARRVSVGCGAQDVFHGDGGHFAWLEPSRPSEQQIAHLEGMRALFSAPLLVGGHMFDTNVHFGLDRNHELDTLTRLNTAMASASEALRLGRTIKLVQADRLANAPWELSLLARIDEGMQNGDIWLAYQPQWDYHASRISGAEALIRWNDPVRGPIRPDEFIVQAERAGRIDALTYWVLEQAITASEAFNAVGYPFHMSINLSAQLADKPSLISSIAAIVRQRGLDCRKFTVEVTETAGLGDRAAAIANLQQLRAMGFRLSIDDFGTGEASLQHLADLPSDELKIDKSFVSRIVGHARERQIVSSTIGLAHALGQSVVAEGIEDLQTFELLRQMGCDVAQGYYVGRPETFEQLRARYTDSTQGGATAFTSC